MAVADAKVAAAGQFDAAVLRYERRLRKLGRVIEVAELRGREGLLQIARLRQHCAGNREGKLVGVARRLAANLVDLQIEWNAALADLQGSRGMQHEAGLGRIELAKNDQQLDIRRQRGFPVGGLLRLGGEDRHDRNRRESRVRIVAPGEVDSDVDGEEEERQRGGAMDMPRGRALQRNVDADSIDANAEDLHRELAWRSRR